MKIFLRVLAVLYSIGALLHLADLFDLRLAFSQMTKLWQIWICYLLVLDLCAAVGLWRTKRWGETVFLVISLSQLMAYVGFTEIFGEQTVLVIFHIVTLAIYGFLFWKRAPDPLRP